MARVSAYCMTQESDEVVRTWIDFMDAAGVHEMIMFFDGAISPAIADFLRRRPPGAAPITAQAMRPADWDAALGDRAGDLTWKTRHSIRLAHEACTGDWLMAADIDEFPADPAAAFAALDAVPADLDAVTLRPAEAVWGPGEHDAAPFATSLFRVPPRRRRLWRRLAPLIFGRWHVYFEDNLLSHSAGKQFLRRGARFDAIDPHRAHRDGRPVNRDLAVAVGRTAPRAPSPPDLLLLHYDAISQDRWTEKFRRRAVGGLAASGMRGPRRAQVDLMGRLLAEMAAAPSPEAARRIADDAFRALYHLDWRQHLMLRLLGGVARLPPVAACGRAPQGGRRPAAVAP